MDQTKEIETLKAHLQDFLKAPLPKGADKMVTVVTREQAQLILEMIRENADAKKP